MVKTPVLPGLFMLQIQEITPPTFDGATYQAEKDQARLGAQLQRVLIALNAEGRRWLTLRELSKECGAPEASVSARLRDLRKPRFGGFEIEHRRRTVGLWEYRLVMRKDV